MAVSTTVVAFTPLLFIAGIMGKFIAVMPKAVIAILVVSLLEALVILPAHLHGALSRSATKRTARTSWHVRMRHGVEKRLQWFIDSVYTPMLGYVVENRYFTFAIGVGVLIISIGIIRGGYVPFVFMPKGESDYIIAEITYPLGTHSDITGATIDRLARSAAELNAAYRERIDGGAALVTNSFSLVGAIPRRDWKPPVFGGHCGEVWIELLPSTQRPDVSVNEVINHWRRSVGEIPGVDQLSFFTVEGGPAGSPIEIRLIGDRFDTLQQAAQELKTELLRFPGTFDVADNFKPGKEEQQLKIRPGARALDVTMGDLGRQVRQAFYGEEALRIQRGKDDIKVQVRYAEEDRNSLSGLDRMWIRTADGRAIPLGEVAEITHGRAYSTIRRVDRRRVITVSSDIEENTANASQIVTELNREFLPALTQRFPGLTYDLEGQEKRTRESLDSLKMGFSLALMGIFLLLASQFKSYIQPIIIMIAIPFGLIGAILGHLAMGLSFTIVSIFGIVALSGIVVNDSLILIDFINRAVRSGVPVAEAVMAIRDACGFGRCSSRPSPPSPAFSPCCWSEVFRPSFSSPWR
jgi:HAE1 family hydrophobic/amphiphilic exporter-1